MAIVYDSRMCDVYVVLVCVCVRCTQKCTAKRKQRIRNWANRISVCGKISFICLVCCCCCGTVSDLFSFFRFLRAMNETYKMRKSITIWVNIFAIWVPFQRNRKYSLVKKRPSRRMVINRLNISTILAHEQTTIDEFWIFGWLKPDWDLWSKPYSTDRSRSPYWTRRRASRSIKCWVEIYSVENEQIITGSVFIPIFCSSTMCQMYFSGLKMLFPHS